MIINENFKILMVFKKVVANKIGNKMCFSVEVERNLKKLAETFHAYVDQKRFEELQKNKEKNPKKFLTPDFENRIYPNYYAPVIIKPQNDRIILPMRYRMRPSDAIEEVPSKYNMFNARLDSLENRKSWNRIFMRRHGLFPFTKFYEWVEKDDKKKLIMFYPKDREILWAPCLYDYYQDEKESFHSFALITTDPKDEVMEMGHDRCPLFLKEKHIEKWLKPEASSKDEIYSILKEQEEVYYLNKFYEVGT